MSDIRFIGVDYGTSPAFIVKEAYSSDGKHLKTIAQNEDGRVLWEEGPTPSKDATFFPGQPPPKVPDEAFEYVRNLLRLAESLSGALPMRRHGTGPYREDYATQEAFDKARGGPVAIEDKL